MLSPAASPRAQFGDQSSIRYKTPLRYPGGKQRITPFISEIIAANGLRGGHYAEPYAGGAGVAIELLLNGDASHIHLNDISIHVYSFWTTVTQESSALCERIRRAELSVEEWRRQRGILLEPKGKSALDIGFSMFYLNRCNRSGVLNGGLIGGLKQTGAWLMDARFPRERLINRIEAIAKLAGRISVTNLDAAQFVTIHAKRHIPKTAAIYLDPPYYERAASLYYDSYAHKDHAQLAALIQKLSHKNWIVSYDAHPDIIKLYAGRRMFKYNLQYSAARAYKGREVFIFSDSLTLPKTSKVRSVNRGLAGLVHSDISTS